LGASMFMGWDTGDMASSQTRRDFRRVTPDALTFGLVQKACKQALKSLVSTIGSGGITGIRLLDVCPGRGLCVFRFPQECTLVILSNPDPISMTSTSAGCHVSDQRTPRAIMGAKEDYLETCI
jgi:hypothetical protein